VTLGSRNLALALNTDDVVIWFTVGEDHFDDVVINSLDRVIGTQFRFGSGFIPNLRGDVITPSITAGDW
jgi:hypothetical protein